MCNFILKNMYYDKSTFNFREILITDMAKYFQLLKRMMYGALCISMTENTGGLGHESTDNRDKFRNRERDCR